MGGDKEVGVEVKKLADVLGPVYNEITENILAPLSKTSLTRFDIAFSGNQKNKYTLDSLIGRTAHILFLDQPQYICQLLYLYPDFFIPPEDSTRNSGSESEASSREDPQQQVFSKRVVLNKVKRN